MKNWLLQKVCPYLDQQTAKHLQGLGNSQLQVSFSTAKLLKSDEEISQFNVTVSSKTGGSVYKSLSGGEKELVSLAVGLALADLAETQVEGKSKFLILDEPLNYLGPNNAERVVTYLTSELTKHRETILFISNDENLKALVPNRIHVEKMDGISYVI